MEALLYEKLENQKVKCKVCNFYCIIDNKKRGICGVRENINGTLYSLNYGKSVATAIDPIEKKPLYNYMPNTFTYSFASEGCNLDCEWCQNNTISQNPKPKERIRGINVTPQEHIHNALRNNCPSISYTYTEPTIYLEYALDTMKLAHKNNLKNIWVTNGYMSVETIELILPYVDALNIDYKGNHQVYKNYKLGNSDKVLQNIKTFVEAGKHVEVTTLLIPDITIEIFTEMADKLKDAISVETPWHITRFFPTYNMTNQPMTPKHMLYEAFEIAKTKGFKTVYLGNI